MKHTYKIYMTVEASIGNIKTTMEMKAESHREAYETAVSLINKEKAFHVEVFKSTNLDLMKA